MNIQNNEFNSKLFDTILAEALKIDCERELEKFKGGETEYTFSEQFNRTITKLEKSLSKIEAKDKIKNVLPKVSAVAASIIVCFSLATNPTVQAFFVNIITKIFDTHNHYEFIDESELTIENFNKEIRPAYMPDGYNLFRVTYGIASMVVTYRNNENDMIELTYGIADGTAYGVDVEHSIMSTTEINGNEAIYHKSTVSDRPSYLIANIDGYSFLITAQIELDEFVKIAESLKID